MTRVALSIAAAVLVGSTLLVQPALAVETERAANVKCSSRFGNELARAFNERDEALASTLIDIHALALRVARSIYDDPRQQAAFARGMSKDGLRNLMLSLFKILDTSRGTVKCMKAPGGSATRILLRLDLNDQGFDYLEFVLEKSDAGVYRAVDWFQLSRGELLSVTIGALSRLMTDPDPGLLRTLFGLNTVDRQVVDQLKAIGALQRSGKYAESLAAMEKLPAPIADSRTFLTTRATAASLAGLEAEYKRTLTILASKYGDDPSAAFILLDHYFYEHQTAKALQAVAAIEQRVGIDGVTTLLKANAHLEAGAFDRTVTLAKQSIQLEPDRADSYQSLAAGHVGLKNYPEAVKAYEALSSSFGYEFEREQFIADGRFTGFVKSAAFARWLPK